MTGNGELIQGSWRTLRDNGWAFGDFSRREIISSTREVIEIGYEFCKYFNSEGAVPWQYNLIIYKH